jgi:hypothetical protein
MKNTVELSISNDNLDCDEVVKKLQELKIVASVTSNNSIVKSKSNGYKIENGCRIKFSGLKDLSKGNLKNNIWDKLKDEFKLNCGNLKINNTFDACVYKYFKNN